MKKDHGLKAHLVLEKNGNTFLGKTRMALLEEIHQTGSISQAAKIVGISYKGAWDAIDHLNNLSENPLVKKCAGGKHGGGTKITEHGHALMSNFRKIEIQYKKNLIQNQKTFKRFSMLTSAQNQFTGKVTKIVKGTINAEVKLKLAKNLEITAVIPNNSLIELALNKGSLAHALFQSSSVVISTNTNLKISARNQFSGKVQRIEKGALNSEVTIQLNDFKTISCNINNTSVEELELHPSKIVVALIKSTDVIIGVNL